MSLRNATIGVSLAGLPFIVPHVLEDFSEGLAHRVGLPASLLACLLGLYLAVQVLGLVRVGRGARAGFGLTLVTSGTWTVVAVVDHAPDVLAGGFRTGALSVIWVCGLVLSQGTAAVLAWRGWRAGAAHGP